MIRNASLHYLRGIAILLVLGYHAAIPGFSGGYIGVDIFFLLSGYLIASKITNIDSKKGIKEFYLKRAKKIYPSLLVVLTLVLYTFWWLDGWKETTYQYFQEATATVLGFVNVGFSSYAAGGPYETSPFLHLWSIAIEIQFYIFAPLLAYLFLRNPKLNGARIMVAAAAVSLASFVVASYWDSLFAYYSSFGRIWEFILGAAIYFYADQFTLAKKLGEYKWTAVIATAIVVAYVCVFDVFIGANQISGLFPILASAVLIYLSHSKALPTSFSNNRINIFTFKPLAFLADISYPLYLIHYPVLFFTFSFYPGATVIAITFSLLAAYIIHILVEKPILVNQHKIKTDINTQIG